MQGARVSGPRVSRRCRKASPGAPSGPRRVRQERVGRLFASCRVRAGNRLEPETESRRATAARERPPNQSALSPGAGSHASAGSSPVRALRVARRQARAGSRAPRIAVEAKTDPRPVPPASNVRRINPRSSVGAGPHASIWSRPGPGAAYAPDRVSPVPALRARNIRARCRAGYSRLRTERPPNQSCRRPREHGGGGGDRSQPERTRLDSRRNAHSTGPVDARSQLDQAIPLAGVCQLVPHAGSRSRRAPRRPAQRRCTTVVLAWSVGHITISPRFTCAGRVTTNTITSATSSAESGVIPWYTALARS